MKKVKGMWIGIITLFPEMFTALTDFGVTGRAFQQGKATLKLWNPRDYTTDKHRTVDDRPYGGGPGMLMKVEPLAKAITAAKEESTHAGLDDKAAKVIYLSPQGRPLKQESIKELSADSKLIMVAGRYEGIDERLIGSLIDEEWSLGDFVLSGGEYAAICFADAMIRLQPGVLGHQDSANEDSFSDGLLDHPHYTRPEILDGKAVPKVLLSGDHKAIAKWRQQQALGRTWQRRPELLQEENLSREQLALLNSFREQQK
ncbi:MAG: tRNA (guanosine(37)-N1)-methyltransferase TrmD [Gammaproteobacteria bacterium]|nr:tRNA (guanosine(37)-N1)-methyltransferase TrmD [Gammaproteobacteria bacterium]